LLGNYRPIAISDALCKVWTGLVARGLSAFADANHIFSTAQEGFRAQKNSQRQIRNLLNAVEDAHLTSQDIYTLYVDFSAAFSMVNHERLQECLHTFGIPDDARRVVSSIYAHATTTILTPHGSTPTIHIRRGTLQGDTLSPLLFLFYIEPLLRWLHQGGRGYHLGCLSAKENEHDHISAAAYADDLCALTNTAGDLQAQADKITGYCAWAGIDTNNVKCGVTAGLFKTWAREGVKWQKDDTRLRAQLNKITLQGLAVPVLSPSESYLYLGLPINILLHWKHAFQRVMDKIKAKGTALLKVTTLSKAHKLRIVDETITPLIDYIGAMAPFSLHEIDILEGKVAHIKRTCLGLPNYFPVHSLMAHTKEGGWGTGPLANRVVQAALRNLTQCLNDDGRLGRITTKLTMAQLKKAQGHPRHHLPDLGPMSTSCTSLRQLHMLAMANLHLLK